MINFSINKTAFLNNLRITKQAISTKVAIPTLSKIKIDVSTEGITLTGSNGQISIENFLSKDDENAGMLITDPGSILLEASFFESVVNNLPEVTFEFKEIEQNQVVLTSGQSEITLKGLDVEMYPRIQEMPTENPLKIKAGVLKEIFTETAFAVSTQESRPILTGLHLTLTDNKILKSVATDSHRMSQRVITLDKLSENFDLVLPNKSVNSFKSVFSDDDTELDIFFSSNQILIRNETISFYTRLVEGNYPDTNRLIPSDADYTLDLTFDVANLRHTMDRAKLLSNATTNGTVKLSITGDQIIATVNSPEVGSVHEEITPLAKSGDDLTISFNPQYLIDALKVIKEPEVRIRFISPVRPFTLVPKSDTLDFVQLVTPVRTN
ncbi:DNA polymerase III subunit beta [Lactococcus chungangensis CAU 28 = DSM 22330]|jgi:DNA polymerase III, beta subunit|uniref:Beta sliding clamp n=2 Tax=Pseudolactococcus chungangensis TaxID=451457 RepID=A0A1K2HH45_9LACT|nr:DNA polymerase III subunit beta [Lactococcus chungangensis]NCB81188.1 DNA polymerase III subunit beta [Bacilli bacterium]NLH34750.1 DNA polymerase III subunit beta [Lactococcus chungangensis]PCS03267.1 DNA polymerase III subunit beta [Lactococcus chungangensis CAU 28 = DSM 22330]SFZ75602.1 DNA polymerase-3 subunit beta [Lactococcus chungangensis CAU 28 = DSM 22330]